MLLTAAFTPTAPRFTLLAAADSLAMWYSTSSRTEEERMSL